MVISDYYLVRDCKKTDPPNSFTVVFRKILQNMNLNSSKVPIYIPVCNVMFTVLVK